MINMKKFLIKNHEIYKNGPPFIIAEAGINHNGDVNNVFKMIDVAKNSGVHAIKFQTFKAKEFITDSSLTYTYKSQGKIITESQLELFERCELSEDDYIRIKKKCDDENLIFLSTPQNKSDLDFLLQLDIPAIKVGSDDFTNIPLLKSYASTNLPLLVSCGMANLEEIKTSLDTIEAYNGYPTVLLLTTSEYPTPPENVNLQKFSSLSKLFPELPLGYSDHTQSNLTSSLAVSFGASVFEKHFTLDNSLPGPDHWFSANPVELGTWSDSIKISFKMMGNSEIKPTILENQMKSISRRSIVALNYIEKGEKFSSINIGLRRPGDGLPPSMFESLIGKKAKNSIQKNQTLKNSDF